jgi:hypothetical protein
MRLAFSATLQHRLRTRFPVSTTPGGFPRWKPARAGVAQWQSRSFPSLRRGFDSLHPLQHTSLVKFHKCRKLGRTPVQSLNGVAAIPIDEIRDLTIDELTKMRARPIANYRRRRAGPRRRPALFLRLTPRRLPPDAFGLTKRAKPLRLRCQRLYRGH